MTIALLKAYWPAFLCFALLFWFSPYITATINRFRVGSVEWFMARYDGSKASASTTEQDVRATLVDQLFAHQSAMQSMSEGARRRIDEYEAESIEMYLCRIVHYANLLTGLSEKSESTQLLMHEEIRKDLEATVDAIRKIESRRRRQPTDPSSPTKTEVDIYG